MLNSLFLAFAMYSKIPVPRADWSKEKMKYVMAFFPAIGLVIGLVILGFGFFCTRFSLPELFRSAGFVLIPLLLTGGIHMDGFIDTTDAISSWQSRERRLEILKDSHCGAFAIIYSCILLIAQLGIWSAMPDEYLLLMGVSFAFSRALSGMAVVTFKNARRDGLVATFSSAAEKVITRIVLAVWIVSCGAVMIWLDPSAGGAVTAAGLLTFGYYRYRSYKEFGGITGDLAGWFLQQAETFMPLAAVLVWYMTRG